MEWETVLKEVFPDLYAFAADKGTFDNSYVESKLGEHMILECQVHESFQ